MRIYKVAVCLLAALSLCLTALPPAMVYAADEEDDTFTEWLSWLYPWGSWMAYVSENPMRAVNEGSGLDWIAEPEVADTLTQPRAYYSTSRGFGDNGAMSAQAYNSGPTTVSSIITNTTTNNTNNYYYHDITNNTYNYITDISYNQTYNTYKITVDNSVTNNYYITYAPTFVNITYVDSAQGKVVNNTMYFQLPDGRNSYNLKAEDVWGEFFLYDVVNYDLVIEDPGTYGLFHMDGNLNDSGAYNASLSWSGGTPSTTYIDHGAFNSALYLGGEAALKYSGSWPSTAEFMLYLTQPGSLAASNIPLQRTTNGKTLRGQSDSTLKDTSAFAPLGMSSFLPVGYTVTGLSDSGYVFEAKPPTTGYYYTNYNRTSTATFYSQPMYCFSFGTGGYLPIFYTGTATLYESQQETYSFEKKTYDTVYSQRIELSNLQVYMGIDGYDNRMPVGEWVSIALQGGRTYVNGKQYTRFGGVASAIELRKPAVWGNYWMIDEMRFSSTALYGASYVPLTHPFDTNKALVLPAAAEGRVAIKTSVPVTSHRFGGVRPTYPAVGDVYVALGDGNKERVVESIQQYQSGGWVAVDGAIYEDGEWLTLKGYDLSGYTVDEFEPPPGEGGGGEDPDPGPDPGGGDGDDSWWSQFWEWLQDFFFGSGGDGGTGGGGNGSGGGDGGDGNSGGGFFKRIWDAIVGLFETPGEGGGIYPGEDEGGLGGFMAASFAFVPAPLLALLTLGLVFSLILMVVTFIRRG